MELSKAVKHGHIVVLSGNKIIKASKRSKKILGVWQRESTKRFILLDGRKVQMTTPSGVQVYGEAEALAFVRKV